MNKLQKEVHFANIKLEESDLSYGTFGNISGINREEKIICIKPSGMFCKDIVFEDMPILDLEGNVLEGSLKPSTDTKTHVALYRFFTEIGGITHTHSKYATIWAQTKMPLHCLGTTHADIFLGTIPCTKDMTMKQIKEDYEKETANQIIKKFDKIDYHVMPGVLVASHGSFTWGDKPYKSLYHSFMLEKIAEMNFCSLLLNPCLETISQELLHKHFFRKHGPEAYYGQKTK